MQDNDQELIEPKIKIEVDQPQDDPQEAPSVIGALFSLFTPSASPASQSFDKRQVEEVKKHKEEIRVLKEELKRKQAEMQIALESINQEREKHRAEKEAALQEAVANPPTYEPPAAVFHPVSVTPEESVSVSQSEIETGGDDTLVDFSPDESKISVESSQIRLLEDQMRQQLDRITELADEVEDLKKILIQERKLRMEAERTLEEGRVLFKVTLEEEKRKLEQDSIERERIAREQAEEASKVAFEQLTAYRQQESAKSVKSEQAVHKIHIDKAGF